jgi:hypothetical protein
MVAQLPFNPARSQKQTDQEHTPKSMNTVHTGEVAIDVQSQFPSRQTIAYH